jgi:FkbH-like protein
MPVSADNEGALRLAEQDRHVSVEAGDRLLAEGLGSAALEAYKAAAARAGEQLDPELCLKLARAAIAVGDSGTAVTWLRRLVDTSDSFRIWYSAAQLLQRVPAEDIAALTRRSARIAIVGSATTTQFVSMLRLAGLRAGLHLVVHEGGYDQYQQDVLDPASAVYAFEPDYVLFMVHDGAVALPPFSDTPERIVAEEVDRWRTLWTAVQNRAHARVVQHTFAVRPDDEYGHMSARLPGSRQSVLKALNTALGEVAGNDVLLVDCDRLASAFGKTRWFDDRYWHLSKQAVALNALPLLARHTAAVLAGDLGLGKKCIAVDLDDTLWGGVVGEDGLDGIRLGVGAEGEAYVAFQETLRSFEQRGIVLAVCSKNNDADARAVFERHPDMRLRLTDIACFEASWSTKSEALTRIADSLDIGLDSILFVDDNPAERELVRQLLPQVDVLALPADPALYARALLAYPYFETTAVVEEDRNRTALYSARQKAAELETTLDLESFLHSLEMKAEIAPFDEFHLPRVAQLIGKTNQFNLTGRRHTPERLRSFMEDRNAVHLYLKLKDRFADHGLVGVAIAVKVGSLLDIDTLLMSCRVIGRTVEKTLLACLATAAEHLGCDALQGTYVPTDKNELVRTMYGDHGFQLIADSAGTTTWRYDVAARDELANPFLEHHWGPA